ncbi:MAG: XdhC family protein [Candidatus Aegiribacteria sp.]|nr:XdhC family protein [Candidatus Aegiribacteria sp.]
MNSIPLWKLIGESIRSNIPCALLLTVETRGSGPGRSGAAMAVTLNNSARGTVGGGAMEYRLAGRARKMLETGNCSPELFMLDHVDENNHIAGDTGGTPSGMICSGSQTTAVFPLKPGDLETVDLIISILESRGTGTLYLSGTGFIVSNSSSQETHDFSMTDEDNWEYAGPLGLRDTVYVIGGGHVGQAIVNLLRGLSWSPVIIDERERDSFEDPPSCRWITAPYSEAHRCIPDGYHNWAVIMTPSHRADAEVLKNLARKNLKYVGMMASSSKKAKIFAELMQEGVPEDFLGSVHCPVGLSIGSRTPEEIAVSIAAQLIEIRGRA